MEPTQPTPTPYQPQITPPSFPSLEKPKQGMWKMPVVIIVYALIIAVGVYAKLNPAPGPFDVVFTQTPTACTQETRICPDGSSVGRIYPACEFAACPEPTAAVPAGWKTYTNTQYGFEVKYPPTWRWAVEGMQSGGALLGFDTGVYGDDASIVIELSGKNTGLSASQVQHNGYLFTFNGNRIDQIRPTFKFTGEQAVCTADAMLCPNGSYVGRTGPNCQFICP